MSAVKDALTWENVAKLQLAENHAGSTAARLARDGDPSAAAALVIVSDFERRSELIMGAITDLAVGKPGSDRESQRGYDDAVRRERASSPHEELARLAILCRLTEDPEEAQRYADEAWQVACAAGWAQNGTAQQ